MIKLGLSIYEEENKEDEDLPPLEESGEQENNKMEEVDWLNNLSEYVISISKIPVLLIANGAKDFPLGVFTAQLPLVASLVVVVAVGVELF